MQVPSALKMTIGAKFAVNCTGGQVRGATRVPPKLWLAVMVHVPGCKPVFCADAPMPALIPGVGVTDAGTEKEGLPLAPLCWPGFSLPLYTIVIGLDVVAGLFPYTYPKLIPAVVIVVIGGVASTT